MWQHTELREVFRKAGWKESHFIVSPGSGGSGTTGRSASAGRTNGPMTPGMMTPSASAMLMTPTTPTANGASGLYHSISANNTLSRPMSTVGGTKYEDHQQFRTVARHGGGGQMPSRVRMEENVHEHHLTH